MIIDFRFPLEMHLVHYAEKYKNLDHAVQYEMGAAVLGVLFDVRISTAFLLKLDSFTRCCTKL